MRGVKTRAFEKWRRLGVFLLLLFLVLVLGNSVRKVYSKKRAAEKALARMNTEIVKLEEREKELQESEGRLGNPEGVEFELRKKFSVAGVGESVAIIVEKDLTTFETTPPQSLWVRIKSLWNSLFD